MPFSEPLEYIGSIMSKEVTIQQLSALASGCDPETGEEFEPGHVLHRKSVVAALNEALKALGAKPSGRTRRPKVESTYFKGKKFNRISAKSRKDLAERILGLPMKYPIDDPNTKVKRKEHARAMEPWKAGEQGLLARVLPHTNDLKFLSIVFQRSEGAIRSEAERLMAERPDLREQLGQ